jgi:hypothetical protein
MTEPKIAHLNLKEMLPTIREAFDNKSLQMFTSPSNTTELVRCKYAGPCAIGVCLSEEDRAIFDAGVNTSAWTLLSNTLGEEANLFVAPENQHDDIADLQTSHDAATRAKADYSEYYYTERVARFEALLKKLEEKYA